MNAANSEQPGFAAAILAGGFGTRLRSVVSDRPKIMADVNGRPFLSYLIDQLRGIGVREVTLCLGYMAECVQDYFGPSYGDVELHYSIEREPAGTGGALALAEPLLNAESIMVMNGDSYVDTDLSAFTQWYSRKQHEAGILCIEVEDTSRYGSIEFGKDDEITAFREKEGSKGPGWINAGIYLIATRLITSLPTGVKYSLERDFFPSLVGGGLFGFRGEGRFIDIGTPESYSMATEFFG